MSETSVLRFEQVSHDYLTGSGASLRRTRVRALHEVSFAIAPGESLGLVGESGSGKSTIARLAIGLLRQTSGQVEFDGSSLGGLRGRRLREVRRELGVVFQDPYASLNPRQRIGASLALPLRIHGSGGTSVRHRVLALLEQVGLAPAERYVGRFPHELSGGQRQRVAIARAIALGPRLVIADEPVASLDVSVAGQVLNLLRDVRRQLASSLLFISHDLGIVRAMCDRTIVLNGGRIIEAGPTQAVLSQPAHPYTKLLLASMPESLDLDAPAAGELVREPVAGGCPFLSRCPVAQAACTVMPAHQAVGPGHTAACWVTAPAGAEGAAS